MPAQKLPPRASVLAVEDGASTRSKASSDNFIRAWRIYRGYDTQEALCLHLSINSSVLSRLESGALQYRQWHLKLLSNFLNVSPRDLIGTDPFDGGDVFSLYAKLSPRKRAKALALIRRLAV